jgi:hypothetical protein
MAGYGPQGSPTTLTPTVPQPSAGAPGLRPPGDSSWLDANVPNEPQFVTNSAAQMSTNLTNGNALVIAQGRLAPTAPNRQYLNTQGAVAYPNNQTQQATAWLAKPAVPMAGVDPAAISWVKYQ